MPSKNKDRKAWETEFYNLDTTRERRCELLTLLRDQAQLHYEEEGKDLTCFFCGHYIFYAPYTEALIQGHVYSNAGIREVYITKICEHCFDRVMKEPDEEMG